MRDRVAAGAPRRAVPPRTRRGGLIFIEIIASYVPEAGSDPREEFARPTACATMVELRADLLGRESELAALMAACPPVNLKASPCQASTS